ncbi:MAG: LTA synthase family protein [Myxococcales bacterium]|nr:LTA synthase family protein [Myxococcales bacterium]MDH3842583.1 LTA synthase family protein [Myxococcales bacterium]
MGWALVVLVCATAPLIGRLILMVDKDVGLRLVDVRGVLADVSVAALSLALVGGLVSVRRFWARIAALVVLLALVIVSFAMFEFVSLFDSLYALSHSGYLADSTFLGGSVRHLQHPILFVVMIVGAVIAVALAQTPAGRGWWSGLGVVFAASVLGQVVLPISHEHDEWRQRHALQANLSVLRVSTASSTARTLSGDVREVFRSDLDGERWVGPLDGRPNVILVMIEAASGVYLPSIAAAASVQSDTTMRKLDALAKDHILFTHVVAHQRQTNRGEYAVLCGDYPKLVTDQSKMTEQVYGNARRCLPSLFKDAGYVTAYIQSAPLGFMLKDQFMQKAGFDELIGDPWFRKSYARTDWGVDDKAFFEQALPRILELHRAEQPFFATLLTVGTHHPYTFPESVARGGVSSREARAFSWADEAVDEFLAQLKQDGVLRDTVVIVTSDESAGTSQASNPSERLLSQSWSFALVMLPEVEVKRIDALHGHVDLALSVADLLGMEAHAKTFIGRSMFRRYDTPRRLFGGNTYARKVIMWEPTGGAVYCDEGFRACTRAVSKGPFGPVTDVETPSARTRMLVEEVARLTRSGRPDMTGSPRMALLSEERVRVPAEDGKKLILGGQYLRVPAGTVVRVDFDLEVLGDPTATVDLHQDVFMDGYLVFERKGIRLDGGDRWRLSYSFGAPAASDHLVVQLYARTIAGQATELRFHQSSLSMTRETVRSKEPTIIRDVIEGP